MPEKSHLREHRPAFSRKTNRFEPRQRFLIVCEGEKTEPNYFSRFPISPNSIVSVVGVGVNTVSLVREAIRLMADNKYDQVWCVFDRDSFPAENFNLALQVAKLNGIKVAYSNEAFELWYVLHFDFLHTGVDRRQYINRLSQLLGRQYQKNNPKIFDWLYSRQKTAILNAKKLLSQYDRDDPINNNPSTTVHLLVEQLNRLFW